ncbi:hypothetical protein ACMFAM_02630 [Escherichia coli]
MSAYFPEWHAVPITQFSYQMNNMIVVFSSMMYASTLHCAVTTIAEYFLYGAFATFHFPCHIPLTFSVAVADYFCYCLFIQPLAFPPNQPSLAQGDNALPRCMK